MTTDVAGARCGRGSTLLDLVAVVGIIAVLVAISVPMVLMARDRSMRSHCQDNLRAIGVAMAHYAQSYGSLPCTRPSIGPGMTPDVSNSGFAAVDPFSAIGPGHNNVPSVLFLLLRTELLQPASLICPSTDGQPDTFAGLPVRLRSNFTDLKRNLSYSVQNPYATAEAVRRGFRWSMQHLPPSFVLAADKSPGGEALAKVRPDSPQDLLREANSLNHDRLGQNVLYADGRVEFTTSPFAGVNGDHIYVSRAGRVLDSPQDGDDTLLLPAEKE